MDFLDLNKNKIAYSTNDSSYDRFTHAKYLRISHKSTFAKKDKN